MKKILIACTFLFFMGITQAQNFQFLVGPSSINFVTMELYKPLEHGTLYYFTDFKINGNGYFDSYTEISKYWNIGLNGTSITAQYNAGIFALEGEAIQIRPVYLFGISNGVEIKNLFLTLDILYRIDQGTNLYNEKIGQGVQLTSTFLRDWDHFQISGYCDFWQTTHSIDYKKDKDSYSSIIMFEPQFWWKFSKRVYLGIEGRLSNFNNPDLGLGQYTNYGMIGVKWNLE